MAGEPTSEAVESRRCSSDDESGAWEDEASSAGGRRSTLSNHDPIVKTVAEDGLTTEAAVAGTGVMSISDGDYPTFGAVSESDGGPLGSGAPPNLLISSAESPEIFKLREIALRREEEKALKSKKAYYRGRLGVLRIVVWKNLLIRKRRKSQFLLLLLQIVLWFGIACLSVASRSSRLSYPENPNPGPTQLVPRLHVNDFKAPLAFTQLPTPNEDILIKILKNFHNFYASIYEGHAHTIRVFDNEEILKKELRDDRRIPYGISIDHFDPNSRQANYSIYMWEKELPTSDAEFNGFDCRPLVGGYLYGYGTCQMKLYGTSSFLLADRAMAWAIQKAFQDNESDDAGAVESTDKKEASSGVNRFRLPIGHSSFLVAEQFPEGAAVRSYAAESAGSAPFYFMLALVSVFSFVVMDMVSEKESKMKEIMKTFGLSSGMFWLSWLITYCLLNIIICWVAISITSIAGVFGVKTSIVVVFLLIYFYLLSLMTMGFLVSVFFHKSQTASLAGMLFNLLLYFLGWMIQQTKLTKYIAIKIFFMLFSTITFSITVTELLEMLPDNGVTLFELFNFNDHSIGIYILMILLDSLIYFVLAWYLDQIVTHDFGSAQHWTFIFEFIHRKLTRATHRLKGLFSRRDQRRGKSKSLKTLPTIPETTGLLTSSSLENFLAASRSSTDETSWVEPVDRELAARGVVVKLRELEKRFPGKKGSMKTVVNKLSLDIYAGEIFGLLGHNGAGKTTTLGMLTGMLQIDGGDASVMGYSLKSSSKEARELISICPQQNLFFEEMTCMEHLIFFAALRGLNVAEGMSQSLDQNYFNDLIVQKRFLKEQRSRIVNAICKLGGNTYEIHRKGLIEMECHFARFGLSLFTDPNVKFLHQNDRTIAIPNTWAGILEAIEKVGLTEKLFALPRMLSGGMKRRLWLVISLIGNPKVVFLDEPTSGVDPMGRQELWRLIQDEKIGGRSLVITTHHMEEADILADRKAIMTSGRLRCVGSSLFLKTRFGVGYYLEVELKKEEAMKGSLEMAGVSFLQKIREFVPTATRVVESTSSAAVAMTAARRRVLLFALPLSAISNFASLFEFLEQNRKSLNIIEYGISMSTLEEVFFKLGEDEEEAQRQRDDARLSDASSTDSLTPLEKRRSTYKRGSVLTGATGSSPFVDPDVSSTSTKYDALIQPSPDTSSSRPPLLLGIENDLVSQKFKRKRRGSSFFQHLRAVLTLRGVQIIHNRTNFFIDVIFPCILLLVSILFREGGPESLYLVSGTQQPTFQMTDFSQFNLTIPLAIDSRLSNNAKQKAYQIIAELPATIKDHLQLVDVVRPELFSDPESSSSTDYRLVRECGLREPAATADRREVSVMLERTPLSGQSIRNYILATSRPGKGGVAPHTLSAGLSFEPLSERLTPRRNPLARRGEDQNDLKYQSSPLSLDFGDFDRLQVRVFYDPSSPHSLPRLMAAVASASDAAGSASKAPAEGRVASAVWHLGSRSVPLLLERPTYVTPMTYGMYVMLSLGLSSLPSRFGIQIMLDKFSGTKHSLIVMGLPFSIYWLGSFLTNYLAMLLGNLLVCGFISYFIPLFYSSAIVPVITCAVFYSASVLLWAYFLSQIFSNFKAYAMTLQLSSMVLSLCPAYVVSVFADAAMSGAKWGKSLFAAHLISSLLFPPYNPIGVLIGCALVAADSFHADTGELPTLRQYFSPKKLPLWSVISAALQAASLYGATVYLDYRKYHSKRPPSGAPEVLEAFYKQRNNKRNEWLARKNNNEFLIPASLQNHRDQDVENEGFLCSLTRKVLKAQEYMISTTTTKKEDSKLPPDLLQEFTQLSKCDPTVFPSELPLILIDDLHYLFEGRTAYDLPFVAVRNFSLRVMRGEIFGLLGPNGAGKTTSINLLTCNHMISAPTRGAAFLGGHDVSQDPSAAFSHLGLCPQFDALWNDITVLDNLRVFARVKNVPEAELEKTLDYYIQALDLEEHKRKRIHQCSGGNKRRVSVAVAFMGDPDVVLMDEPSSGIDPVGRRKLAELIHKHSASRSVLVTTHSMEEAEALCTRIGIIVNGELSCVNTSLAIRNKYGSGVRLEIKFDESSPNYRGFDPSARTLNPWQKFLKTEISEDVVDLGKMANRVVYSIPTSSASLGRLFSILEKNKNRFAIEEYGISQPTLEQVFISFAKRQKSAQESLQEIFR